MYLWFYLRFRVFTLSRARFFQRKAKNPLLGFLFF
nr:MAG TPA: hypothetical protein [Caudoviricetes sp.]